MRYIYRFLLIILLILLININCRALTYGGCDYSTISRLKKYINNVNISYTYEIRDNKAYFDVILNNIPEGVYFVDSKTSKEYNYNNLENGEIIIKDYNNIQDGQYKFYVDNELCKGVKLGNKYYKFPIYNIRFNSEECKDIQNYSLCKKWIAKVYSDEEFKQKINKYKEELDFDEEEKQVIKYEKDFMSNIVEFYIKYYYYFLPFIIIICALIIFISNRKNKFKL